jgi:dihydroneopterin aldolase
MSSDLVFIRGMEFEANHGYTAAERRKTRRFRLHIELHAPLGDAARSDRLADTVDYFRVCETALRIGTKETFRLLEALAGRIGEAVQESYPHAAVIVEIEKLAPPCPGVPDACGVKLHLPPRG